jgi:hypothetical protein
MPPAYVAWRAGTIILHRMPELIPGLFKWLEIRAQLSFGYSVR